MKKYLLYFMLGLGIVVSCQEDEGIITNSPSDTDSIITVKLSGYVQKGPFINGTAITIAELDSTLTTTGKVFSTQIADNKGSFSIKNLQIQSPYMQLLADGFYFDEVKGEKSATQLTLFALTHLEDNTGVNANLLSHMERTRVIYLIQEEEKNFSEAKAQALQEILVVFGIKQDSLIYSEQLDISQDGDQNAILLAISAILQGNNSVAELSELVANIMTDLREDGLLDSQTNKDQIREQAMQLDLPQIRTNLEQRYKALGMQATIPNFEQYVDSDGDGILNKDEDDTPVDFSFKIQTDVAVNDTLTSNVVTITGLKEGGTSDAKVQGGKILLNGMLMEDTVTQLKNGDEVQLQLISSNAYADTTTTSISIGTLVKQFQVVTDDYVPDKFIFTELKNVAVDSFYTSNTITVSGLPYPTPALVIDGILIKNGNKVSGESTMVKNGDQLAVRLKSSPAFASPSSASLIINTMQGEFEITTDDYTPDEFSFTSVENAKRNASYYSDTVTITGLAHPMPYSSIDFSTNSYLSNAIYINGEKYTTGGFNLKDGDQVWIESKTGNTYSDTTTSSLKINEKVISFSIVTLTNPWQRMSESPGHAGHGDTGFSMNGKIYMGTGKGYDENDKYRSLSEFFEFDPAKNEWKKIADFGGGKRVDAVSFQFQGIGYVGGGNEDDGTEGKRDLWKYDPSTDEWTRTFDLPFQGRGYSFSVGNRVFVGVSSLLWELVDDQWVRKNENSFYSSSYYLFSRGTKAYFESDYEAQFWEYDTDTDGWRQLEIPNKISYGFTIDEVTYASVIYTKEWYRSRKPAESWEFVEGELSGFVEMSFSINGKGYCYTEGAGHAIWEFTPPLE
uniref:Kelch repeat-containing protein n=1 Tax=Roseihalotalea indica TaxID=2867963 RepID=A0AA49GJF7_9BACT|nr:kelch repeat-containing protein [Tunicatimonas sp. TK19036]